MSAEGAHAAIVLQRDRLTRLSTVVDNDPDRAVTPAIACLVRTALEDLDDAAKQLEAQLRLRRKAQLA